MKIRRNAVGADLAHLPGSDADLARYGLLCELHAWLAYGLLALVPVHAGAALHHAWVRCDGMFGHMALGRRRAVDSVASTTEADVPKHDASAMPCAPASPDQFRRFSAGCSSSVPSSSSVAARGAVGITLAAPGVASTKALSRSQSPAY